MTITRLNDRLSVSPQIHPGDLARLHASGFRCIINNRPDTEGPGQAAAKSLESEARRLGMDYRHIPILPGRMTDEDALAFGETIATADGPVLAFCRSGSRSAKAWERSQQLTGTCG